MSDERQRLGDQYRDTFPKSMKSTRRMLITEAEFEEASRSIRYYLDPSCAIEPIPFENVADFMSFCRWIIERVADGTILVEEPK